MNPKVQKLVDEWLALDTNPITRKEIEDLVAAGNETELEAILGQRLVFGTSGLRGPIRAGNNCMNLLTVQQACQGLVDVCLKTGDGDCIVVGHDARNLSLEFAELTAAAFISRGVKVYRFSDIVPTSYVPFGIQYLSSIGMKPYCGVMVTASHNPAADNGYKVYWNNACSIISPVDKQIQEAIEENLKPWVGIDSVEARQKIIEENQDKFVDLFSTPDFEDSFAERFLERCSYRTKEENAASTTKIAYSAMHGVGTAYVQKYAKRMGLPENVISLTPSQCTPDPTFPTSAKPNPEIPSNLKYAMDHADANDIKVILATDPDADRLAMAEKTEAGEWHIFHGNEIALILLDYILGGMERTGQKIENGRLISSTVSTRWFASVAKSIGCDFVETLTGFKWLGTHMLAGREEGRNTILGFEEAIGYMIREFVPDKDGITACCMAAEASDFHYKNGETWMKRLEACRERWGSFAWCNKSILLASQDQVPRAFNHLTQEGAGIKGHGKYINVYGDHPVVDIRDLQTPGLDTRNEDEKPVLPVSSSPMITLFFANPEDPTFPDCVHVRPSGTEPLLKIYVDVKRVANEEAVRVATELYNVVAAEVQSAM